ncbi:O-6-methylguanine DNA methyltransferase [Marinobacter pelagius]|uniref:O-6-methylguanine DNA methyltransferase n=1 Tax=Marinobacter pelagius TaxID=379482 RepID=A0A366GW91_9GAMM|nr:methylated-DNA--[protein]-cysteine S-methyltransferase [Marinobacter pelagius]RBP31159.1 O-6-methylguanine DNA methyltransferase [Marinobacter pelagius]
MIRYAIDRCNLGWVLAGADNNGLCTIELGDDPDSLHSALEIRFPDAILAPATDDLDGMLPKVVRFIDAPQQSGLDLPLSVEGTGFQKRVWEALQTIPPGETVSYAELARQVGNPKAIRAVAGACAANRLAVVIPCHRVVRSDGNLSGYRWGIDRKRALLEREAAPIAAA